MHDTQQFCSYFQARIDKPNAWFVTAILKAADHISIDRTIDVEQCLNEFFVPVSQEANFLTLMNYFVKCNLVFDLQKLPNRLADRSQQL